MRLAIITLLLLAAAAAGCNDDGGSQTGTDVPDAGDDASGLADASDDDDDDDDDEPECESGKERCPGGEHWVCFGGEWVEDPCPEPTTCDDYHPLCACPGDAGTAITGTVHAPNGLDPVSRAFVFLPSDPTNIPVEEAGAHCIKCLEPGLVKKSTTTDAEGAFRLTDFPEGQEQTVVVRKGPFQRTYSFTPEQCSDNQIPDDLIRLPADPTEAGENGRFPSIAVSTGMFDRMEEVIAKAGIQADYIDIFNGGGDPAVANKGNAGEELFAGFDEDTGEDNIMKYDIVFINCGQSGGSWDTIAQTRRELLHRYVSNGGRLYVTDMAYDFIEQPFPDKIAFLADQGAVSGAIDAAEHGKESALQKGTVMDDNLEEWLSTNFPGEINNNAEVNIVGWLQNWVVVDEFDPSPSNADPEVYRDKDLWVQGEVTYNDNVTETKPLTISFNIDPPGTADLKAADRLSCGRVLFSSYHTFKEGDPGTVTDAGVPDGGTGSEISVQERILEYLVLEIGVTICENIVID